MSLTVRQAANLLGTNENQVHRWIDAGEIPFDRAHEQLRFNRTELLEWATGRRIPVAVEHFADAQEDDAGPSFAEALRRGGVHAHVGGGDRREVLRAIVALAPIEDEADREDVLDVLTARENAGTSAMGEGIAIPHVRNPVVLAGARAAITLCFLSRPVDFAAVDGKPVDTVFFVISPTIRAHLELLARISAALQDERFRAVLARRAAAEEVLAAADAVDARARARRERP